MKIESWMNRVRPIGDNIVAAPLEEDRYTKGGIALPDGAQIAGRHMIGRVFGVGPGVTLPDGEKKEMEADVGDVIVFVKSDALQEIEWDGNKFWCVSEQDVLVVITEAVAE